MEPSLKSIEEKLDELIVEFKAHKTTMESAFLRDDIGGVDVGGHRAYHLAVVQRAAKLESRRNAIIDKALSGALSLPLYLPFMLPGIECSTLSGVSRNEHYPRRVVYHNWSSPF